MNPHKVTIFLIEKKTHKTSNGAARYSRTICQPKSVFEMRNQKILHVIFAISKTKTFLTTKFKN